MLAVTDFKLRFFGSALGYVWTLMRPLLLFGVLYFVFTEVVRIGGDIEHYPVVLLSSIVLFTFFSETTSRGVTSLIERENLLRKVRFPRLVIPLAVALHALFNLGLNLIVVFVFVLATGVEPRASWLEVVPLLLLLVLFATSVAMLVSALYVRYRDMQPIWEVALQILFYASPIIYVISFLPDSIEHAAMANPIASIVTQWRHAVIDPSAPSAASAIGGGARLLIPLAVVLGHVRAWASGSSPARPRGSRRTSDGGGPEALRVRLEELERERHAQTARANAALAAAQDRNYWLDRWNVDLNALMRRRGARQARAVVGNTRRLVQSGAGLPQQGPERPPARCQAGRRASVTRGPGRSAPAHHLPRSADRRAGHGAPPRAPRAGGGRRHRVAPRRGRVGAARGRRSHRAPPPAARLRRAPQRGGGAA